MKQKKWFKKAVSGMLTAVTLLTSVVAPIPAMAAEIPPEDNLAAYVSTLPQMEAVADQLDAGELVTATDYDVEIGAEIDLKTDFSGISYDKEKVKVSFYEAQNEDGQDFSTSHADTYKATYYAEPVSGNPAYRFNRSVIVKEPVATENQTETGGGSGGEQAGNETESEDADADADSIMAEWTEEPASEETEFSTMTTMEAESIAEAISEAADEAETESDTEVSATEETEMPAEALSEADLDAALEAAEGQETYDWESGLTLSGVLIWATEEEGIDLGAMEAGGSVRFRMPMRAAAATGTQTVDITKGSGYYYADYGLGSYVTYPYTVRFGNITAVAYCVQPSKAGPGDGVYTITKLGDSKTLAKVCYYGTKASGDEGFFAEKHPELSTGARFIVTHIAAAYANGSSDAFSGTNSTGQSLAMELYNYCVNMPEIPDVAMSFSDDNVTAYKDGNGQRTKEITFKADALQSIVMKLPDGVKLHNVTTGKTSKAGADVEITGGTKFYLSAPLTQTSDVSGTWSATMKGSITTTA